VKSEELENLTQTLDQIQRWVTAIRNEITEGNYTPEDAGKDYENLMFHEGMDLFTALLEYSESN